MNKKLQIPYWIWKTMKVSIHQFVILAVCCGISYANTSNGQRILDKNISLEIEDARFKGVLTRIEEQANVRFIYSSSNIDNRQKVSLSAINMKLDEALKELLNPLSIGFSVVGGNRILLKRLAKDADQRGEVSPGDQDSAAAIIDRTVSGTVSDENGEPLPGVSILIKGTQQGLITDAGGAFSIRVPDENTILVFSFVGYLSQEVPVGNRTRLEVSMEVDEKGLEEVVVVGYGTQKKVNLTGAVSALNEKDFGRRQVGQSSLLLQGVAPGVTVTQNSGQPGRDAGSIRIRGIGTISDANPMVLVDGVEMSMNNIDPETIESISVLKDASSAAIYGSRAANGVILVTTKRAKKDQTSISYSTYHGWDNPTNLPQKVNALDHMTHLDIAYKNSGRSPIFENLIQQYIEDGGRDTDRFPDTDWMDLLLKSGKRQNHVLNFNKGYENLRLAASFGYFKQDGIINNTSFERLSFRLNSDMQITSKLSAKFDLMFIQGDRPEPISQNISVNNIFFQMYRIPSSQPAIFSNGLYGEGWGGANPLAWANDGGTSRLRSPQVSMNFQFEYKPLDWLTANIVFSPIYTVNHTKNFVKQINTYHPDGTVFFRMPLISTLTENYLLPGDIFATREPNPVLQQLESAFTQDISVNDCFKPVSKYWDRISRPEQLIYSLPEVMRVLTSPAETGAVTLSMPQDVQTHAYDFPEAFFRKRVWKVQRSRPDKSVLETAARWIAAAKKPVIVAGGGVIYSDATDALHRFASRTGIPVGETFAGKGATRYDAPFNIGGFGATGTRYAIEIGNEADLVIGIGTRYSDFTTASKSIFQNPDVRFININVSEFDAFKQAALPVIGDARAVLEELEEALTGYAVDENYREKVAKYNKAWDEEVTRIYEAGNSTTPPIDQAIVIGTLNEFMDDRDVMINASGSAPGDLHKLWRATDPKNFHLEYGYSTMGYEIAAGLGAKLAAPDREIYVICGDGGYLMNNHELVTAVQEGIKFTVLLLNNNGFASIGGLSESIGGARFGTQYRFREEGSGQLSGNYLPVDLAKNAESLGAEVIRATDRTSLVAALQQAKTNTTATVIYIETSLYRTVKGYNAWWEVPVAEVSTSPAVQQALEAYRENKKTQRVYL